MFPGIDADEFIISWLTLPSSLSPLSPLKGEKKIFVCFRTFANSSLSFYSHPELLKVTTNSSELSSASSLK